MILSHFWSKWPESFGQSGHPPWDLGLALDLGGDCLCLFESPPFSPSPEELVSIWWWWQILTEIDAMHRKHKNSSIHKGIIFWPWWPNDWSEFATGFYNYFIICIIILSLQVKFCVEIYDCFSHTHFSMYVFHMYIKYINFLLCRLFFPHPYMIPQKFGS